MPRDYTVTDIVGRPSKYSEQDFRNIINKTIPDVDFAEKFDVSVGTIAGIRTNQSKKLNIEIKDRHKNQTYGGKKMTERTNARRRELYKQKNPWKSKTKFDKLEINKRRRKSYHEVDREAIVRQGFAWTRKKARDRGYRSNAIVDLLCSRRYAVR